jgi:LAS superfamily LD-carboxypeptidase LdcB
MKEITFAAFLLFSVFCAVAFAADDNENKETEKNSMDKLAATRAEVSQKMHRLRVKLIKEDSDLKALHRKIMALHKELAIRLGKNEEMKELRENYKRINSEMESLLREQRESK